MEATILSHSFISHSIRNGLLALIFIFLTFELTAQTDTLILRGGKKIIITKPNSTTIYKVKRKWLMERSTMLFINLTRIVTLHQPLIGIGTFRLHRAAYEHTLDMVRAGAISHSGFNRRAEENHFRAENVASGYKSGFRFYLGWLFSEGHRKNMLSWKYLFTGIGICKVTMIKKKYKKGKLVERQRAVMRYATNVFR